MREAIEVVSWVREVILDVIEVRKSSLCVLLSTLLLECLSGARVGCEYHRINAYRLAACTRCFNTELCKLL